MCALISYVEIYSCPCFYSGRCLHAPDNDTILTRCGCGHGFVRKGTRAVDNVTMERNDADAAAAQNQM